MFMAEQDAGVYQWRKATYSANDGACIEVAMVNDRIAVRDSKNPTGGKLKCPVQSWRGFIGNVKRRERDPAL